MPTYEIGISSATAITLYPEYDAEFSFKQMRSERRSPTGKLRLYKWGQYYKAKLPVPWINGSEAAVVNSWWNTNTELLFFVTSGGVCQVQSVYIMNDSTPFAQHVLPYDDYYEGEIELESY